MKRLLLKILYFVTLIEYCPKCMSTKKKFWHQMEGETDYEGYDWCADCGHKYWSGFQDRVFG